jgi:hypothetical protein
MVRWGAGAVKGDIYSLCLGFQGSPLYPNSNLLVGLNMRIVTVKAPRQQQQSRHSLDRLGIFLRAVMINFVFYKIQN